MSEPTLVAASGGAQRKQAIRLTVLLIILASILYYQFGPQSVPAAPVAAAARLKPGEVPSTPGTAPAQAVAKDTGPVELPKHVNFAALEPVADPGTQSRNPFQFYVAPLSPPPPAPPPPPPPAPRPAPTPLPPQGPPPITLKYMGLSEQLGKKTVVLTDGRSIYYGRGEGAVIDGKYRVVKIGQESVTLSYLDGRGLITIRQSGLS